MSVQSLVTICHSFQLSLAGVFSVVSWTLGAASPCTWPKLDTGEVASLVAWTLDSGAGVDGQGSHAHCKHTERERVILPLQCFPGAHKA